MDDETLTALIDDLDTAADTFVVLSRCLAVGEQIKRWKSEGDQIAGGSAADGLPCQRCGAALLGSADGAETCWCALPCPRCDATPGVRCRRPSEHGVFGNLPHDTRIALARDDAEPRAVAGNRTCPRGGPAAR